MIEVEGREWRKVKADTREIRTRRRLENRVIEEDRREGRQVKSEITETRGPENCGRLLNLFEREPAGVVKCRYREASVVLVKGELEGGYFS